MMVQEERHGKLKGYVFRSQVESQPADLADGENEMVSNRSWSTLDGCCSKILKGRSSAVP